MSDSVPSIGIDFGTYTAAAAVPGGNHSIYRNPVLNGVAGTLGSSNSIARR